MLTAYGIGCGRGSRWGEVGGGSGLEWGGERVELRREPSDRQAAGRLSW